MIRHKDRLPDIPALLRVLSSHQVRYVITGSVAAQLYGVALEPNDLDVTPALDLGNLERLVRVLREIEASPRSFGHWETTAEGEKAWVEHDVRPEALAHWRPDPQDLSTLDHLYLTRIGNFDVVPELAGPYETLIHGALKINAYGGLVQAAQIGELLARLTVPRRAKDRSRVEQLRAIQRTRRLQGNYE